MASNYFLNNHVSWALRKFEKFAPYYVFQISFSSVFVRSLLSLHLGSAKNSFSNWVLNSSVFCSLQLTFLGTLFGFINEVSAGLTFNASLASWPIQTLWRLGPGGCEGRVGGACRKKQNIWCVWTLLLTSWWILGKLAFDFLIYKMGGGAYCIEKHIDERYQYFKDGCWGTITERITFLLHSFLASGELPSIKATHMLEVQSPSP